MAMNILLTLTIVLANVQFGETGQLVMFARNSSLDEHVCPTAEVVLTTTCLDSIHCLLKCWLNLACVSAFYNENAGKCAGCGAAYFQRDSLSANTGGIYYELKNKRYGQTCLSQDTCIGENGSCWNGTCQCVIGYPYDFKSRACVDSCASYGSTYQEFARHRLIGLNARAVNPLSLEECHQLCTDKSRCLSFEYIHSDSLCHISYVSPLTYPESLETYETTDLYVRNCEE